MVNNPEKFANFYSIKNLGFDLILVDKCYDTFKRFFVGNSCLELGPATGYMTKNLVNSFQHVTAVEGSKTLFEKIPGYPNLTKINCLFEDYNPSEKFDTIIINHVLEHLEDPINTLKRAYNWLNKNGVCIIGVPNAKSFHRLAAVKMGLLNSEYDLNSRDIELGHHRVYDLDLLKLHVKEAGFKILHESGIFLKFLSNAQIEKMLDENIINAYFELASEFYQNAAEIFVIATKK